MSEIALKLKDGSIYLGDNCDCHADLLVMLREKRGLTVDDVEDAGWLYDDGRFEPSGLLDPTPDDLRLGLEHLHELMARHKEGHRVESAGRP